MRRRCSHWVAIVLSTMMLLVLSSCGDDPGPSVSEPDPKVAASEMLGVWVSSTGATIRFEENHAVEIEMLPADVWELSANSDGLVSLTGTWQLCDTRLSGGGVVCSNGAVGVDIEFEGVIKLTNVDIDPPDAFAQSGESDVIRAELSGDLGARELYVAVGPDVTELERHRFTKR